MIIYLSIFFIFIPDLKGQETCGSIQDPSARILCQQQSKIVKRNYMLEKYGGYKPDPDSWVWTSKEAEQNFNRCVEESTENDVDKETFCYYKYEKYIGPPPPPPPPPPSGPDDEWGQFPSSPACSSGGRCGEYSICGEGGEWKLTLQPLEPLYDCGTFECFCESMKGFADHKNRCKLSNGQSFGRAVRKEYRTLTDEERRRFHAAVLKLKSEPIFDGDVTCQSTYRKFARIHETFAGVGGAHGGPSFLPWHREYLKRFEFALRRIDPSVAIPYWDTTLDSSLPNPRDSIIWSDDFMGDHDDRGNVVSGPFKNWHTLEECPYNGEFTMEMFHSRIHLYVGGDMFNPETSGRDPLFFMHHAFVDYLWELWRQRHQRKEDRPFVYAHDLHSCSSKYHFSHSSMEPFSMSRDSPDAAYGIKFLRNSDGLSNVVC
uniref:Tyrosinase copper-binding domain-containing protein n=1 Tax=Acrobeloides nanus TaxID=290746 RepID=A0A914D148_9BILA